MVYCVILYNIEQRIFSFQFIIAIEELYSEPFYQQKSIHFSRPARIRYYGLRLYSISLYREGQRVSDTQGLSQKLFSRYL